MNSRIDDLMYQAGLTAQGCWDHMDEYDRTAILKFAELIVGECLEACSRANEIRHFVPPTQEQVVLSCMREIEEHFGVEE